MAKIDEKTLAILSQVTIEGNVIFLNCGQLDRKDYLAVNKILASMRGKWDAKVKGHVFKEDPTDRLENVLLTGEITTQQDLGHFPTPPPLAKKVIELADIRNGHAVLEPSAGEGGLADLAADIVGHLGVDCVELQQENASLLASKGFVKVICGNFLELKPEARYDRVVMNPPFARQQDIEHVTHAFRCLKPGGRLVSVMSAGVLFRETKLAREFRTFLEKRGGYERNPEGSFKASGTNVNTVTVVLDKAA